jgi:hypothetical protein
LDAAVLPDLNADNMPADLNREVMRGEQPGVGHQEHDLGHGHIHVGLALLPDSIDIDPCFEAYCGSRELNTWAPKQNADGIQFWAKHFAPVGYYRWVSSSPIRE